MTSFCSAGVKDMFAKKLILAVGMQMHKVEAASKVSEEYER
jgi:hypothetical protein